MNNTNKAIIGLGLISITTLGIFAILKLKKKQERRQEQMLATVADEGYETAYDVLYPLKKSRLKRLF